MINASEVPLNLKTKQRKFFSRQNSLFQNIVIRFLAFNREK
jgi:hypothetical protein